MRSNGEEVSQCAHTHLYKLWCGPGQRSECCIEYSGKGPRMYPGAQGNILFFGGGKRFWTDCLYSHAQTGYEQAGWMKEEPPSIYGGECQTLNPSTCTNRKISAPVLALSFTITVSAACLSSSKACGVFKSFSIAATNRPCSRLSDPSRWVPTSVRTCSNNPTVSVATCRSSEKHSHG